MEKLVSAFATALVIVFIAPVVGVLVGAFSGWVVSLLAPGWVTSGLALMFGSHINAGQLVELGAALGFLGGFFRVSRADSK